MRARGVACEAVVYPDEGHEISGFAHRIDYDRRTVEFITTLRRRLTLASGEGCRRRSLQTEPILNG